MRRLAIALACILLAACGGGLQEEKPECTMTQRGPVCP